MGTICRTLRGNTMLGCIGKTVDSRVSMVEVSSLIVRHSVNVQDCKGASSC